MPNRFLVIIAAADQDAANQRLQTAINESGYGDDCGILSSMHCIDTTDDLSAVFERVSIRLESGDQFVVAPVSGPWAAHNAPTMEDCGRITSQYKKKREPVTEGSY